MRKILAITLLLLLAASAGWAASDEEPIEKLIARVGLADSVTDASRKRKAGAIEINGERVTELLIPAPSAGELAIIRRRRPVLLAGGGQRLVVRQLHVRQIQQPSVHSAGARCGDTLEDF